MSQSRAFCFTWNNPTAASLLTLADIADSPLCQYLVFGRETAPTTGTVHLQGYVAFSSRRRFDVVCALLTPAHVEIARGSAQVNRTYCTKDGDFVEHGSIPTDLGQGRRTDIDRYLEYLRTFDGFPTVKDIMLAHPELYLRYSKILLEYRDAICTQPALEEADFNEWQALLAERLANEPEDDRKIEFYVDPLGGSGKSWFIRKLLSTRDDVQMLSIGKRDDLAYAVDETKRIFLLSVPRSSMEFLNYPILEMIKDRLIFSTKYHSRTKRLIHKPHIVVFCNELPDVTKLTNDRYKITELTNNFNE